MKLCELLKTKSHIKFYIDNSYNGLIEYVLEGININY